MAFNPKDAAASAKDIATNAIERAADIVESAGHIVKGDVAGGVSGIVQSSIDIGTHAAGKVKEIVTGRDDEDEKLP